MSSLRRVMLVGCCVGAMTFGWSAARSDTPVESNLDVMRELTTGVVEELVAEFPHDVTPKALRLAPSGRDERYEFIGNVLAETLTSKGYRAYAPMAPAPADSGRVGAVSDPGAGRAALNLEYQVIDFTLRYPKIYRSFLIGGKKVKRDGDVRVLARLIDPTDGLVVWTGEASRSYEDAFPYGAIEEAEAGLYEFTKPPRDSRKWGRIIEPVVVSGIIVGLIYLFFTNQGD